MRSFPIDAGGWRPSGEVGGWGPVDPRSRGDVSSSPEGSPAGPTRRRLRVPPWHRLRSFSRWASVSAVPVSDDPLLRGLGVEASTGRSRVHAGPAHGTPGARRGAPSCATATATPLDARPVRRRRRHGGRPGAAGAPRARRRAPPGAGAGSGSRRTEAGLRRVAPLRAAVPRQYPCRPRVSGARPRSGSPRGPEAATYRRAWTGLAAALPRVQGGPRARSGARVGGRRDRRSEAAGHLGGERRRRGLERPRSHPRV